MDNFTKRQIDQLLKPCENASIGCTKVFASNELENHQLICEYAPPKDGAVAMGTRVECTFHYCGCPWRGMGQDELDTHLKEDLNQHLEVS